MGKVFKKLNCKLPSNLLGTLSASESLVAMRVTAPEPTVADRLEFPNQVLPPEDFARPPHPTLGPISSMVPISRVPDLCLMALFRQMQLKDQIRARKVCRKWEELVSSITPKRSKLTILVGSVRKDIFDKVDIMLRLVKEDGSPLFPSSPLTEWNTLEYDSLNADIIQQITSTYCDVKQLQFAIQDVPENSLVFLVQLLHHWRGQLVTFKLNERCETIADETADSLFAAINSLSALKCLDLDLINIKHHDMPIIAQLTNLNFSSTLEPSDQFVTMLQQYAVGNQSLASIGYWFQSANDEDGADQLALFTSLSDHLRRRFTDLFFSVLADPVPICRDFPFLTSVHLSPSKISFRQLFQSLSKLSQLISLSLDINFQEILPDEEKHLLLPQVKSVKALTLMPRLSSHSNFDQMVIEWTLPNVQIIEFVFTCYEEESKCTDCGIVTSLSHCIDESKFESVKNCLRQIFRPLKRKCTLLHTIFHCYEDIEEIGPAEDLINDEPQ